MTELETMLPELNTIQHKWLQEYIAEQRLEELQNIPVFEVPDEPNNAANYIIARIAQLNRESRG